MDIEIQTIPNPDSPNNDAFEAVVELYYQTCGYITSSGKWFWVRDKKKKQRGYQDIDVLAINGSEVLIVSVTSNLDDKLSKTKTGEKNKKQLEKLCTYFERVKQYFLSVPEYQWLISSKRTIKPVVAYNHVFKRAEKEIPQFLKEQGIEILSAKTILSHLTAFIKKKNLKIQDQMLRTIQLLEYNKML